MEKRKLVVACSAPVKAILSGEHGVVHGTPGIAITFEPANKVSLFEESGAPGFVLESDRGSAVLDASGEIIGGQGKQHFAPFAVMVKKMIVELKLVPKTRLVAVIESAKAPKGMGNSASIAAALASALLHYFGRPPSKAVKPEQDELWMLVQSAEEVAHGGRPSGIDAMAVCYGPAKLLRVVEGGKPVWKFEGKAGASAPAGTKFIVVDTFSQGERAKTGDMVKLFAQNNGLLDSTGAVKALVELGANDKRKLSVFVKVFEEIVGELHEKGDARKLGAALKKNHLLLSAAGVSTKQIDEVVEIAENNGAFGAKLTGAGGNGGAVIILAPQDDSKVVAALQAKGYAIFGATPVARGARKER